MQTSLGADQPVDSLSGSSITNSQVAVGPICLSPTSMFLTTVKRIFPSASFQSSGSLDEPLRTFEGSNTNTSFHDFPPSELVETTANCAACIVSLGWWANILSFGENLSPPSICSLLPKYAAQSLPPSETSIVGQPWNMRRFMRYGALPFLFMIFCRYGGVFAVMP